MRKVATKCSSLHCFQRRFRRLLASQSRSRGRRCLRKKQACLSESRKSTWSDKVTGIDIRRTVGATEEIELVLAVVDVRIRGITQLEAEFSASDNCSFV